MSKRLVYGWGVNDAGYTVRAAIDGKRIFCPYYMVWSSMIRRCYCEAFHENQPTYKDCKISPDWKYFCSFHSWMERQNWGGKELDKDLIGDGKLYSPKTCCFVERWLNMLFTDHGLARGEWPIGVCWLEERRKFSSKLKIHGKTKNLGRFDTAEEAHTVYKIAKLQYVEDCMKNYLDQRIKEAVLKKARSLYTNSSNCRVKPYASLPGHPPARPSPWASQGLTFM